MRIIVDTNIVVSAILKNNHPESVIQYILEDNDLEWIASQEILDEYQNVLQRKKFNLPKEIASSWIALLKQKIQLVINNTAFNINFSRDNNDEKFLNCALSNNAHFLITGDKDFTEAQKILNTTVISVAQFKKLFSL